MPRLVQRRADQIVHGSVDHREVLLGLGRRWFQESRSGQQHAAVPHQIPAGFQQELEFPAAQQLAKGRTVCLDVELLLVPVADAQPAAHVHVFQADSLRGQPVGEFQQVAKGVDQRVDGADLGADVAVDPVHG